MRRFIVLSTLVFAAACGRDSKNSGGGPGSNLSVDAPPPPTVEIHDHPSEGPHHGTLVELGKEEYHAEVVHSKDTVTIYILDGQAKSAVPIDATEVTVNVVHDGKPEQFKLAASPDAGETGGKSSRFTVANAELAAHIDDSAAAPKLSLTIAGKPYRGEIKHDHDGHAHDHAH